MARPEAGLAGKAGAAIFWNTVFVPLKLLAELAATLIKTNGLSQAAFGLLALVSALANTMGLWVDLGIDRALPKFIPEQERQGGRAAVARLLRVVTALKLAMLLVVGLLFLFWSRTYLAGLAEGVSTLDKLPEAERARLLADLANWGWLVVAGVLLLVALGAFYDMLMAYLLSFFRHRAWNSIALATALLGPGLIILTVLSGSGVPGVLLAMVATPFVSVALAAWQVRRVQEQLAPATPETRDKSRETRDLRLNSWRGMLPQGLGAYTGVSHLLNLSDWATSVALASLVMPRLDQVALLTVGFQLVRMALTYLFTPLAGVQVPLFTRIRAGEGGTLDGAYQGVARLLLLLLVPGGVGLSLLAAPLLAALFPAYVDAAPLVWVLAPCLFLDSLLSTAQIALMVYERYRAVLLARLLSFVSVPLLLLLVPAYGPLGAAVALGLARLLARGASLYLGRRELQLGFPRRFALRVTLASLAMALLLLPGTRLLGLLPAGAALPARLAYLAALLALATAGALAFLLVLRLLGGLEPADRRQLLALKLPFKRFVARLV